MSDLGKKLVKGMGSMGGMASFKVKIDDPNITIEECIRLEEEKARRHASLSCDPTVSSLNNDEIDFRISFDESDDEDCTTSLKISRMNFLPLFNLKDETSLSKCDEEEQNILNFNDLFPFNVTYPDELKTDIDNDNDKVDIEHSSRDLSVKPLLDVINTDVGAYAHGLQLLLLADASWKHADALWPRIKCNLHLQKGKILTVNKCHGAGEVGSGEGELVVVLERWFGSRNHGKGAVWVAENKSSNPN
ncbi:hypothetical protein Tco_0517991 [Tanacetum coccineum]